MRQAVIGFPLVRQASHQPALKDEEQNEETTNRHHKDLSTHEINPTNDWPARQYACHSWSIQQQQQWSHRHLRPEKHFSDMDLMVQQMKLDTELALDWLANNPSRL